MQRRSWRRHPRRDEFVLILALVAAVVITVIFALRSIQGVAVLRGGDVTIAPWMSIPYIARSNRVPAEPLFAAAQVPPDPEDGRPIGRIAREQGRAVGTLIADVQQAVEQARAAATPVP